MTGRLSPVTSLQAPVRSSQTPASGSQQAGDQPVLVGRLGKPHGLRGRLVLHSESDHPGRFVPGAVFATDRGRSVTLVELIDAQGVVLASFGEVADRGGAEELRGALLYVTADRLRPLDEGEFWPEQLVGLEVRDPSGAVLGRVAEVEVGEHQDRLMVQGPQGSALVPLVDELVVAVEPEAGYLVIDPIPGLFDPVEV